MKPSLAGIGLIMLVCCAGGLEPPPIAKMGPPPPAPSEVLLQNAVAVVSQRVADDTVYYLYDGEVKCSTDGEVSSRSVKLDRAGRYQQSGDFLIQFNPQFFKGFSIYKKSGLVRELICELSFEPVFAEIVDDALVTGAYDGNNIVLNRLEWNGDVSSYLEIPFLVAQDLYTKRLFPLWDVKAGVLFLASPKANRIYKLSPDLELLATHVPEIPEYLIDFDNSATVELVEMESRNDEEALKQFYRENKGRIARVEPSLFFMAFDRFYFVYDVLVMDDFAGRDQWGVVTRPEIVVLSDGFKNQDVIRPEGSKILYHLNHRLIDLVPPMNRAGGGRFRVIELKP